MPRDLPRRRRRGPLLPTLVATVLMAGGAPLVSGVASAQTPPASTKPTATPSPKPSTGEPWTIPPLPQSSLVLARDGSIIGQIGREWRQSVPVKSLPKYVPAAFIAVEDKRFYDHDGVDLVGVAGAIKGKLLGDNRGGASTITQQLVGNLHPDVVDRRDKSIGRKLREQSAAREMEKRYSKEQILEAYLNAIAFGRGAFGIEAAARLYFGKPAARLTLAEAATLAALPKGPALYDPIRHPDRALQRRNVILGLMADQGLVSEAQADGAKAQPVETAPATAGAMSAPYVADLVRKMVERAGFSVTDGGYRIHTTIDPSLQRAANEAVEAVTAELEARPTWKYPTKANHAKGVFNYVQAAVVALDAGSGDIRALVGGRDFREGPFNRAIDGQRQPGSAFKPIVYAAALAQGLTPNAMVADTSIELAMDNGTTYKPKNADGEFLGYIPLREALGKSRNPVAVQLFLRAGPDSVVQLARRLGIDAPVAPYPASALGASVLQPLDLVQAYATINNLGVSIEPRLVARVEDSRGRVVWGQSRPAPVAALDPRVAFIARDLLREPVERGTAAGIRRWIRPGVPLAGKTGTTDDNSDTWFVGMTPDVVIGAWLGFDRPRPLGSGVQGGTLAAPVVGRTLGSYYASRGTQGWPLLDGLVIGELDRLTGLPADGATPPERRYAEFFLPGTEPLAVRMAQWRRFTWVPDRETPFFAPPSYGVGPYAAPRAAPAMPATPSPAPAGAGSAGAPAAPPAAVPGRPPATR
ncbi:MAG: PBP1A family penicillin-binding protein [Gemmatimonadaceae bacterium]|nr:PBP1A family penicillin-binding protein [Gemmatimonadaceae bacterium]